MWSLTGLANISSWRHNTASLVIRDTNRKAISSLLILKYKHMFTPKTTALKHDIVSNRLQT